MRLDRYIAQSTDLSRSQVKQYIKAGQVSVDGDPVFNPGLIVAHQQIVLNSQTISLPRSRYIMLNKPAGYICATTDSQHPTVIDLLQETRKQKLQIVGRLDKDTTGLVLLTDDGQWNHRITSPNSGCIKKYFVTVNAPLKKQLINDFRNGVLLHNEKHVTLPATLTIVNTHEAEIAIQEGKYHQIKRMFAATGYLVTKLHRYQIGSLTLDSHLAPGEYRSLTTQEANSVSH